MKLRDIWDRITLKEINEKADQVSNELFNARNRNVEAQDQLCQVMEKVKREAVKTRAHYIAGRLQHPHHRFRHQ